MVFLTTNFTQNIPFWNVGESLQNGGKLKGELSYRCHFQLLSRNPANNLHLSQSSPRYRPFLCSVVETSHRNALR